MAEFCDHLMESSQLQNYDIVSFWIEPAFVFFRPFWLENKTNTAIMVSDRKEMEEWKLFVSIGRKRFALKKYPFHLALFYIEHTSAKNSSSFSRNIFYK